MGWISKLRNGDEGANLVEFALLAPLLILLVLGIVEFGFKFSQYNELRHGVREGARYAAVSQPDLDGGGVGSSDVIKAVCDAIDLPGVTLDISLANTTGSGNRLDYSTLTVVANVTSLTGAPLISNFVPTTLTNEALFRLEQDSAWSTFSNQSCP